MIQFTQTQKDEFDKLCEKADTPLFDAMREVRSHEAEYPVLYLYLFNSDNNCSNQKDFSTAWVNPDLITIEVEKYYLLLFASMYISVDPDNEIAFTAKDDYEKAYQKQFTQDEIDDLQDRPWFSNRVALNNCKVEVSQDDKDNPITVDDHKSDETNEDFDEDKSEPVPPDEPENVVVDNVTADSAEVSSD